MQLRLELSGYIDEVQVSGFKAAFLERIFKHCMVKNKESYFVNNCFKGVLYFDTVLAERLAEKEGFAYSNWRNAPAYYRLRACSLEGNTEIAVHIDGKETSKLLASDLPAGVTNIRVDPLLEKCTDEVMIFMGAIDKGTDVFTLDGFEGQFDPDKLKLEMDIYEDFRFEDMLIRGITYDGRELTRVSSEGTGMKMITPVLMSHDGVELDLYDFIG